MIAGCNECTANLPAQGRTGKLVGALAEQPELPTSEALTDSESTPP